MRKSNPFFYVKLCFVISVLLLLCREAVGGERPPRKVVRPVTIFEFSVTGEKSGDESVSLINDVVLTNFLNELEADPRVGDIVLISRENIGSLTEEEYAKQKGINYYIVGNFEPEDGNARIRARWVSSGPEKLSVEHSEFLGKREVKDFALVEKKAHLLAKRLLLKALRKAGGARVFVWCFRSMSSISESRDYPFIDELITLELPYRLRKVLAQSRRFTIIGISPTEYNAQCLKRLELGTDISGVTYLVSGRVRRLKHRLIMRLSIEDLSSGEVDRFKDVLTPIEDDFIVTYGIFPHRIAKVLAIRLYELSIKSDEDRYGPIHEEVATGLSELGLIYYAEGEYDKAEPLFKRYLAIRKEALGPDHPDVAQILDNLAGLYYVQGKYAKAERFYERSLAIRERALGPDNLDVATTLNNLAAVYDVQGEYAKAEPLYRRALAIREKVLGPNHPDVATSLEYYAGLLRNTKREAEAEKIEARAKEIRAKRAQK